jgi:hypothetical protein
LTLFTAVQSSAAPAFDNTTPHPGEQFVPSSALTQSASVLQARLLSPTVVAESIAFCAALVCAWQEDDESIEASPARRSGGVDVEADSPVPPEQPTIARTETNERNAARMTPRKSDGHAKSQSLIARCLFRSIEPNCING